jgi:uncharacterized protein YchJ
MKIWTVILFIVVVLGIIALVALAGGLLVLLAYGVGLLINLVMHLEPFQATALSLVGVVLSGWFALHIVSQFMPAAARQSEIEDEYEYEDEDDFEDDEDEDEEDDGQIGLNRYPGVPLWRQPLKQIDFSNAKPDDRCPCGSGRKYKNCHGSRSSKP